MRVHVSPRREFTVALVTSLALSAALLLLLIRPALISQEVGVGRASSMGGGEAREGRAFLSGDGSHESIFTHGRDRLQEAILDALGPLMHLFQAPVMASRSVYERFQGWQQVEQENHKLRSELSRLASLAVHMDELSLENQRLRLLLNMSADPLYRELAAQVVGDSSSAFAHSLLLNAGRDHGVAHETTVMAAGGVMGRVVRVARRTALVLTLLDLNSRVPVLVQRSRVRAIVAGHNQPLLGLEFVPKGADIRVGDRLVTSGIGGIFPKGLMVGFVQAIEATESTGLFHVITVRPAVDFDRAEEVRLLLPAEHPFRQDERASRASRAPRPGGVVLYGGGERVEGQADAGGRARGGRLGTDATMEAHGAADGP